MRVVLFIFTQILLLTIFSQNVSTNKLFLEVDGAKNKFAELVIDNYQDSNEVVFYNNLFILQISAGSYLKSIENLNNLRKLYKNEGYGESSDLIGVNFEFYSKVKNDSYHKKNDLKESVDYLFNDFYIGIDVKFRSFMSQMFTSDSTKIKQQYNFLLDSVMSNDSVSVGLAVKLLKTHVLYEMSREFNSLVIKKMEEDADNNFVINDSTIIIGANNSQLSATIVRPREMNEKLPAVLIYSIYADNNLDKSLAMQSAQRGYIGIVVNTRGKRLSQSEIEPFENDNKDAYHIIDWISKQEWCNGSVGMYGGSYLGFAQWASVKNIHSSLKTIVPQVAVGIGIDYPMQNNVFMSYMLRWIKYVTNNKYTDIVDFQNETKWDSIFCEWYTSGKSFRSLDSIEGGTNKVFQKWLDHPSHDSFWQNMVPYKEEFSKINIPVLSITGYFDADQLGAMYYYKEHFKYNPSAEHYMVIGPYDHGGAQGSPAPVVEGYSIDSVARVDVSGLVFDWFDYVLKDSLKPQFLKGKITYQIMGANKWEGGESFSDISNSKLKLFLSNTLSKKYYKLEENEGNGKGFIRQEVDFQDRSDCDQLINKKELIIDSVLHKMNGVAFISNSLDSEIDINGAFEANINLRINKKDVDLSLKLYEVTNEGHFFLLSDFVGRASYLKDNSSRTLLHPDKKQNINIFNTKFVSKRLKKGSRILLLISVNKTPYWQINYGTGKDVSDETILDGKKPLLIDLFNDSYLILPTNQY